MNHYREATQDEIDDPRRHHVQWLAVVPVEDAMSRAEWEATIDYEAAHLSLYDSTKMHQPLIDAIDAAVGEDTP